MKGFFELQLNTTKKGFTNTLVKKRILVVYNDSCLSRAHKQNNRTYKIVLDEGFFSLIYYYFHMTNKHPIKTPDENKF